MHIAMFAHYALPHTGGVETVVEALCRRLAVRHRVTLVTSAWGDAHGRVRDGARTTWFLPAIHASERFGVPYPVPTPGTVLRDALADVASADVFHVHGALYAQTVLGRRAARRAGSPVKLGVPGAPGREPGAGLSAQGDHA